MQYASARNSVLECAMSQGADSTALRLQAPRFPSELVGLNEDDPCPWGVVRRVLTWGPDGTE